MKKVVIYPFFSQQDKRTGQFLLNSCGSTKMNLFLAERIATELDAEVTMVLPNGAEAIEFPSGLDQFISVNHFKTFGMDIPANNLHQRLAWNPVAWDELFTDADLVINHHEVLGWPLKSLYPKLKVIQMNVIRPEEPWPWMAPLFYRTWGAVDLIVALGVPMLQEIAKTAQRHGFHVKDLSHWPLSYDQDVLMRHGPIEHGGPIEKDIDLLFVLRGSSTNYSHHKEFLQAIVMLRTAGFKGKIAFTDITRYMVENHDLHVVDNVEVLLEPKTQRDYIRMLWRSRAVIALNDNLHGGMSFREAVFCGACPIASRTPGYEDLLGATWPYYINPVNPHQIAVMVLYATQAGYWNGVSEFESKRVHAKVAHEGFQTAWERIIRKDISRFLEDQR